LKVRPAATDKNGLLKHATELTFLSAVQQDDLGHPSSHCMQLEHIEESIKSSNGLEFFTSTACATTSLARLKSLCSAPCHATCRVDPVTSASICVKL